MKTTSSVLMLLAVGLVACSGGGGGQAPTISDLSVTPGAVYEGSGGGSATVNGSVRFADGDGDVASFTLTIFDSTATLIATQTFPATGAAGVTSGVGYASVTVSTAKIEQYTFELYATDQGGRRSNVLTGTFRVVAAAWRLRTPMPTPRAAIAVAANDRIYLIGGSPQSEVVEVYEPATDTWGTAAPLSVGRNSPLAVAIGNKIYVAEGDAMGTPAAVEEYDVGTDAWSNRAPFPTAFRHGPATFALDGKMYVVGGVEGGETAAPTLIYDPATDSWSSEPGLDPARTDLAACTIQGKGYALGGEVPLQIYPWLSDVDEYDPLTNAWTPRPPMPMALFRHTAVNLLEQIVILGGFNNNRFEGMLRLDPTTGASKTLTSPPVAPGAVAVAGGRLYLFTPQATYEYVPEHELN